MNERTHEGLSALMDGETGTGEALEILLDSPAARATWARYHLIGDVLRDAVPDRIDPALAARVRERLVAEPTVLAPRRPRAALLRPLAGLAIAASVAGLAVIVLDRRPGDGTATATPAYAATQAPAEPATVGPPPVDFVRWEPADAVAAARLNGYLVNYSEQRSTMAVPGVLPPYVRLVGHEGR